jgi:hypothetical protein
VLRVLHAFAWLRWRTLLNSLERTSGRDVVARMSTAIDQLAPAVMALVLVPSALALASVASYTGWVLAAGGDGGHTFDSLRWLLLALTLFAVAGPFMMPPQKGASPARLILLPISRAVLFAAHLVSALAEPWVLLAVAPSVALPIGLAAGGQIAAAGVVLLAGALLVATLAAVTLVVTSAIELVVRNRRRGELLALLLFLLVPLIGISAGRHAAPSAGRDGAVERHLLALMPSEFYTDGVRAAVRADHAAAAQSLLVLAGSMLLLHGLAFVLFARLLASPAVDSARVGTVGAALARWRLPGLSPGASAIALGQLRLTIRTPRGRFALLSPLVMFMIVAGMLLRSPSGVEIAFLPQSGFGVAALTSFLALLAILPFSINQFAVDGAGLTLTLLAPIETRTLLAGKAVGNALAAAIPGALCTAAAKVLFPGGHPALWACVPLGIAATYVLAAPVAAALSAVFPRSVDLNSIGRGSNAHGAAAFLGTLVFLAAGASCLLPLMVAMGGSKRVWLAPAFLLIWVAVCGTASAILFRWAAALFDRRRESLSMLR